MLAAYLLLERAKVQLTSSQLTSSSVLRARVRMTATHYCYYSGQVVTILYCIGLLLLRLRVTILYCIGLRRAYTVSSRGHDCHSLLLSLGAGRARVHITASHATYYYLKVTTARDCSDLI